MRKQSHAHGYPGMFQSHSLELEGLAEFGCIARRNLKDPWERIRVSAISKLWTQNKKTHIWNHQHALLVAVHPALKRQLIHGIIFLSGLTSSVDLDPWVKDSDAQRARKLIDPILWPKRKQHKRITYRFYTLGIQNCSNLTHSNSCILRSNLSI